jgi:hypothetical protein
MRPFGPLINYSTDEDEVNGTRPELFMRSEMLVCDREGSGRGHETYINYFEDGFLLWREGERGLPVPETATCWSACCKRQEKREIGETWAGELFVVVKVL